MSLVKWGFVALLLLPLAEAITFIALALAFGWFWTVTACLGTSLAGLILLRHSGRSSLDQFLAALRREGIGAIHLENPGLAGLLGGILLLVPGFITDVLGALLFLPQFRRWARSRIGRARRPRRNTAGRTVIDLTPDQWQRLPDPPPKRERGRRRRS